MFRHRRRGRNGLPVPRPAGLTRQKRGRIFPIANTGSPPLNPAAIREMKETLPSFFHILLLYRRRHPLAAGGPSFPIREPKRGNRPCLKRFPRFFFSDMGGFSAASDFSRFFRPGFTPSPPLNLLVIFGIMLSYTSGNGPARCAPWPRFRPFFFIEKGLLDFPMGSP